MITFYRTTMIVLCGFYTEGGHKNQQDEKDKKNSHYGCCFSAEM